MADLYSSNPDAMLATTVVAISVVIAIVRVIVVAVWTRGRS